MRVRDRNAPIWPRALHNKNQGNRILSKLGTQSTGISQIERSQQQARSHGSHSTQPIGKFRRASRTRRSVSSVGRTGYANLQEKTPGRTKTDTTRDPFAQLAYQRAQQDPSIDYTDIRDYGTVVDGGDITAALQAALDAGDASSQFRIRVPMVGAGEYTCGAVTFPAGRPITLELDCRIIELTAPWIFPGGYKVLGKRHFPQNFTHPYRPMPGPWIRNGVGFPAGSPLISLTQGSMFYFEALRCSNGFGPAMKIVGGELGTIKNCTFGTDSLTHSALIIDSCILGAN